MIDELNLAKVSWEGLVDGWDNANQKEEQAKAEAVTLKEEMRRRLEKEKVNARVVSGFTISKALRLSFADTSLEFAEQVGAVKKVKDDAKLSALKRSGAEIEGAKETEYVMIRRLEQPSND